jgi:hypothetical protein
MPSAARFWRTAFHERPVRFATSSSERVEEVLTREVVQDVILEFDRDSERAYMAEDGWLQQLTASPRLGLVSALHGPNNSFASRWFSILIRSPNLKRLREIDCFADAIGLEGVEALVESLTPFRLQRLVLHRVINPYPDTAEAVETVRLLARSPTLAGLEYLGLYYNGLGEGEVDALVASPHLRRSLELEIEEGEELAAPLLHALQQRFRLR